MSDPAPSTKKKAAPRRRKKKAHNKVEELLRALQALAAGTITAYRLLKPLVVKRRRKKSE